MNHMSKRRSRRRSLRTNRRGASAVEFAIVAPVFFLAVFAMFEFSRVNVIRHTADNAAYEAARIAIVPGATAAEATAEAERILRVVGARDAVVTVNPNPLNQASNEVTVSVAIPMARNTLTVGTFTGTKTLRAQSTLRTERVATR